MESLRENAEKTMKSPRGSSVANRALELIGNELGMFRNDGPPKPLEKSRSVRLTLAEIEASITVANVEGASNG